MTRPTYGETWVYESIVGALPGVSVSERAAVAIQFVAFETAVLALGWYYGLPEATVAGTASVLVAAGGSALMLRLGDEIRALPVSAAYRRLLFGSSIEVVLGVLAYVALVTYLFVTDPRRAGTPLVEVLFGPRPPTLAVYLTLLVLWDLTYRIGTAWWASVVGLYRSATLEVTSTRGFLRVDALTLSFGLLQLGLLPFVRNRPVLAIALVGHVAAVVLVSVTSMTLLWVRKTTNPTSCA